MEHSNEIIPAYLTITNQKLQIKISKIFIPCVLEYVLKVKEAFKNASKLLNLLVESRGIEPLTS